MNNFIAAVMFGRGNIGIGAKHNQVIFRLLNKTYQVGSDIKGEPGKNFLLFEFENLEGLNVLLEALNGVKQYFYDKAIDELKGESK